MAEDMDRSGLFKEIQGFSQRKLRKVETKVTSGSGEVVTEKRGIKGLQTVKHEGIKGSGYVVDNKPDLQVGMIIPGLFISSQDVAADKKSLETYEITHILNLAYGVDNAFEDDYNYKKLEILDVPDTDIRKYFDECFEFIDEARHYGNCLVHCNAGVSRCTTICTAYLMFKDKMTFTDALNTVREARPFAKPNEGFMKQLQEYNDEMRGSGGLKEANIDDAFTARQRAEIEAEKAALVSGASSVKNKLKQFGAQLDAHFAQRAKCIAPIKLPLKKKSVPNDIQLPGNMKAPPPPPLPNNVKAPPPLPNNMKGPPPPPPPPNKWKQPSESLKRAPDPPKPEPKKLIINREVNNRITDPNSSPSVDETPISVKDFRKNFELQNNKTNLPKVQTIPATPKTNAMTNNPWNRAQPETPSATNDDRKKKIFIKQKSKEAPDEEPKRLSTRDLANAFEKANSPSTGGQLPYSQRRRQTTQLVDNNTNEMFNKQPINRRNFEIVKEIPTPSPPPPQQPMNRTIRLAKQSSASPSPAASSPMSSNRNSPQPISHSPSPAPNSDNDSSKMVFGRVRPPRLSITGRTLSQASQTLQDVSNKANNDSTLSGRSASNSRSESPVLSAVGDTRDTKPTKQSKSAPQEPSKAIQSQQDIANSKPVSDSLALKRTTNSLLDTNHTNQRKSCSPSPSSGGQSSDEELEEKTIKPKHVSQLTMQLKPNNKTINTFNDSNNEQQNNDLSLTEPSIDNHFNSKRVPLGKTAGQQSFEKNKTGLNRSSSAQILKLIKSNTRADLGLDRVEEDDEIEALLMELEKEGVDNIDWDELNVNYKEVKDIIDNEKLSDDSSDESSDEDSSDDDEAIHMVINRQAPAEESESDQDFEVVDDEEEEEDEESK